MATYYVNNNGLDSNAGTQASPWKTINQANSAAAGSTILFAGGQLFNDAVLSPASNVTIGSYGYGLATISGGVPVTGWTLSNSTSNIWKATFTGTPTSVQSTYGISNVSQVRPRNLFYNNQRCVFASAPASNYGSFTYSYSGGGYTMSTSTLSGYANPNDIEFEIQQVWTDSFMTGMSFSGTAVTIPTQVLNNFNSWFVAATFNITPTYVLNAYEIFTANATPGTFYHNRTTNMLYVIPPVGAVPPPAATIIVPIRETIANITNTGISISNIQFSHSTCYQPHNTDGFCQVGDTLYNIGSNGTSFPANGICGLMNPAVQVSANNTTFTRTQFARLGGPALGIVTSNYNTVQGCLFRDISSAAIQIGDAAHYSSGAPTYTSITNSVFRYCGVEFKGSPTISQLYANNSTISYNDLAQMPYTAISIGYNGNETASWSNNNTISYNKIRDAMMFGSDGGALYTQGPQTNVLFAYNDVSSVGGSGYGPYAQNGSVGGKAVGAYLDNGCGGVTVSGNVFTNVQCTYWAGAVIFLNIATGGNPNIIGANAVDAGNVQQSGSGTGNTITQPAVEGTTAAFSIAAALGAGVQSAYADVLTAATVSPALLETTILNTSPTTLVAYWPLNDAYGATTIADIVGGNNGSVFGIVVTGQGGSLPGDSTTGAYGLAASGANVAPTASFNFGTSAFTFSAFVHCTSQIPQTGNTYNELFIFSPNPYTGNSYVGFGVLSTNYNGQYYNFAYAQMPSGVAYAVPGINDGKWHHIAVTRSGNSLLIYVDGVSQSLSSTGLSASSSVGSSTAHFGILGRSNNSDNLAASSGLACETAKHLAIWNGTALSAAQIANIANAGLSFLPEQGIAYNSLSQGGGASSSFISTGVLG